MGKRRPANTNLPGTRIAGSQLGLGLLQNAALLVFACAIILFQFANAAMLPLMAALLTKRVPETATLILSVCILALQLVVATIAPEVGRLAQRWGRRPLLSLCFVALTIRCAVFAITSEPFAIVAVQLLDGISAATLGVLMPLAIADVMRGSGHFNLAQGVVGAAVGIGASFQHQRGGIHCRRLRQYFRLPVARRRRDCRIGPCHRAHAGDPA